MASSLAESQAINEIARCIYDFLPGKPYPYADPSISFAGVAHQVNLAQFWHGGSKLPAITLLLDQTLQYHRDKFCDLILEIVRKGLVYKNQKGEPITREQIVTLNTLIQRVSFKIPELWDPQFLDSLPRSDVEKTSQPQDTSSKSLAELRDQLIKFSTLEPQTRGYAFEVFLQGLFAVHGLSPRGSFRLTGEQIDGSCQLDNETYLVEAKWHQKPTAVADLLVFREKVEAKSQWARGLFISNSGFSEDALQAFGRGRSTNLVGISGQDL